MNIKDFDKAQELVCILEKVKGMVGVVKSRISSNAYSEAEGYSLFMSLYSDGSGSPMDFEGCCIANEVLLATEGTLLNKISEIEVELVSLGVEMGEQ